MEHDDETTVSSTRLDTDAIVEEWFVERIHNSPASRHSEVIALLLDAKDDLKRRLRPVQPDAESEGRE